MQAGVPLPADRVPSPYGVPWRLAAVAGAIAAALALAAAELLAAFVPGAPSPTVAAGDLVIALQPPGAKDVVVALFGTADKLALGVATVAVVLVAGAAVGVLRARRPALGLAGIAVLAALPALAALRSAAVSPVLAAVSFAVVVGVGVVALDALLGPAARWAGATDASRRAGAADGDGQDGHDRLPTAVPATVPGRRAFLAGAGALGIVALAGTALGRTILEGRAASVRSAAVRIPRPVDPAPTLPPDPAASIPGLSPLIVPNDDFYRIDTAVLTPSVDLATWSLRVHGMVDREVTLTFDQLLELPIIERHVTIACVSNEVGGPLVGNATWSGVRLTDALGMAGIQPGATQVVGRSVDGFTAGFPTSWVTERERDALVAVTMNGSPLPAAHGFPARLIVPGLYGYVSATKWLAELELTTLEGFDAYWVPLGWAKEAPILTQSRIDVPRNGAHVAPGRVAVAGVAWAPDRGVSAVDVRIDDGAWQPATIVGELGPASWVQWRLAWDATPGGHVVEVRATDGTGAVQTDRVTRPDPDGARGHHAIRVIVG